MFQQVLIAVMVACPLSLRAQTAQPPQNNQPPNGSSQTNPPPSAHPILDQLFKDGLKPDQVKVLGEHSTLEEQAAAMNPEQKASVRQNLASAEAKAKTPKDLEEIAQGYLLLDGKQKNQGENAFRVARQLTEKDPKNPAGWRIAAEATCQMGDLHSAKENAKAALRLDPHDKNAFAVYMLSQHNVAGKDLDAAAVKNAFSMKSPEDLQNISGLPVQRRDDSNLPMKLPVI